MNFRVLFMAVALSTLAVVAPGTMFTDRCDKTYKAGWDCQLQRACPHKVKDACNGRPIVVKPGQKFTDSCGKTYIVESTCKLHRVSS
eukprot:contig_27197_g6692